MKGLVLARRFAWTALSALLLLPACDPIYGINRVGQIPSLPELTCVEGAIRSVPEVESVRRWEDRGGRPLTLTGIKAPDRVYYFAYDIGGTGATLYFTVDYKDRVRFSQHLISIHTKVPQEQIDAIRPVMLLIERALEERCTLLNLSASITEYCSGVDCPGK